MALFEDITALFHRLVDLAPWHEEAERNAAHDAVEEHVKPLLGRNEVPAGVQEQTTPGDNSTEGSAASFPTGTE